MSFQIEDLHKTLEQHLPQDVCSEVKRILYGNPCHSLEIPEEAKLLSENENFDLQAYTIAAKSEETRPKRTVRIGAIQNQIVLPTTDPIIKQVNNSQFILL